MNKTKIERADFTIDPVEYFCREANKDCNKCAFRRLYPQDDKPCITWALALGEKIVERVNKEYTVFLEGKRKTRR